MSRRAEEFPPLFPVVRVLPAQPHCFAFGGFDLQMIAGMEAAQAAGIEVGPLDLWSRRDDFDIVHFWGLGAQHESTMRWCRRARKRVVLSALLSYPTWRTRLRYRIPWSRGPHAWPRRMLDLVDALTVVNQEQADVLQTLYGVHRGRIFVVPNVVHDRFLDWRPSPEVDGVNDVAGYVLSTGNICPRKNQRALVQACRSLGVPLVLVGEVLTGEQSYGDALAAEIAGIGEIRWLKGLPPGSSELASLYARASLFALPSHDETQPISALEAVAMGRPLVLGDRPYARQGYFAGAALAEPRSVASIMDALQQVLADPDKFRTPRRAVEGCRSNSVGSAYAAVYRTVHE